MATLHAPLHLVIARAATPVSRDNVLLKFCSFEVEDEEEDDDDDEKEDEDNQEDGSINLQFVFSS